MGKWLIMDWVAKDTAARSTENRPGTEGLATTKRVPSCRGPQEGESVTVMHNTEPLILRKVSS
jgi:hypothetical protein